MDSRWGLMVAAIFTLSGKGHWILAQIQNHRTSLDTLPDDFRPMGIDAHSGTRKGEVARGFLEHPILIDYHSNYAFASVALTRYLWVL